jgi:hypothetical protein
VSEQPQVDANALATTLMNVMDTMKPIFETAEGMKADMEKRGWSPTAAEQVALTWLTGAIAATWRQT